MNMTCGAVAHNSEISFFFNMCKIPFGVTGRAAELRNECELLRLVLSIGKLVCK